MTRPNVSPGTVTVFTDVMCGWSTLALHRFYEARDAAGLTGQLHVDLQLFLLEDLNRTALTTQMIEPEKPRHQRVSPGAGVHKVAARSL